MIPYYDDSQYRWFVGNKQMPQHSEAASPSAVHSPLDAVGTIPEPVSRARRRCNDVHH